MNIMNFLIKNPLIAVAFRSKLEFHNNTASRDTIMETRINLKHNIIKAGWTLFDASLVLLAIYVFFF
jgi:hypothetical protein